MNAPTISLEELYSPPSRTQTPEKADGQDGAATGAKGEAGGDAASTSEELTGGDPSEENLATEEGSADDDDGNGGNTNQGGSPFDILIPMTLCFLVFWFLVIRPEKRQRKAREAMLSMLTKGDEVVTSGGIHGIVAQVKDDVVTVQVSDGVRIRFSLAAVQNKITSDKPAKE